MELLIVVEEDEEQHLFFFLFSQQLKPTAAYPDVQQTTLTLTIPVISFHYLSQKSIDYLV
jgi:hypothetical protein